VIIRGPNGRHGIGRVGNGNMKHLFENWRKYINEEEEIEENFATAALAGLMALGGGGKGNVDQYDTDTSSQDQTTMQVDAETQAEGELQQNEDGSYSMEYSNPVTKGMVLNTSLLKKLLGLQGKTDMMNKLFDAGLDAQSFDYSITGTSMGSKSITLKATPK
jgi:hypothetical protein